ncbi:uracil-DNA glycosylase [Micromonospora sp. NPDC049559]|uniref:uracil-DNA glycosylase n=1 Tax=Micromonospora sp. NPDC049559 TaxID=3155923 RepID=UPI00344292F2
MDPTTGPRADRDAEVVKGKLARLDEPHVAPITRLVEQIRVLVGTDVPYVDPTLGGVDAEVLFLFESPARTAVRSALLSPDDDDPAAANVWEFYRASGLDRRRCVHWNAVPWPLGADRKSRHAERNDIEQALPWLSRFVDLLPRLRLVVALGDAARQALALYLLREDARLVPWLAVAHPSGRVRGANPRIWQDVSRAFDVAARITAPEQGRLLSD